MFGYGGAHIIVPTLAVAITIKWSLLQNSLILGDNYVLIEAKLLASSRTKQCSHLVKDADEDIVGLTENLSPLRR